MTTATMEQADLLALVMAGGSGTRFWPQSTGRCPKQYLRLLGDKTLLECTLDRFEGLIPREHRFLVTVKEQEHLAQESANFKMPADGMIFEPLARNTAPCILLSLVALKAKGASDHDVVVIVPADHVIGDTEKFQEGIRAAATVAAQSSNIVTVGIVPTCPHTGYGYIQRDQAQGPGIYRVKAFTEKPDRPTAEQFVASKAYYWNAGIFVASVGTLLQQFAQHAPELYAAYPRLKQVWHDENALKEVYGQLPKISFDYAIMEKSSQVMVVEAKFNWNDLGSWDALEAVLPSTENNTIVSANGHYFQQAQGNIIYAPGQFVTAIGVQDLIVIANHQSLVIVPKKDAQKIKEVVEFLKQSPQSELRSLV